MQKDSNREDMFREIREREASLVAKYLPQGVRLLEIGAGRGYQARYFQSKGYQVEAIDVENNSHNEIAVFPFQIYDGHCIPFPDKTFNVVFSSNVLEHVLWCENLLLEMGRVLKDDGLMLHVVPTSTWRIWTSVAHYIYAWQSFLSLIGLSAGSKSETIAIESQKNSRKRSILRSLRYKLFPFRHGVRGNWLTEVYYFSTGCWNRMFQNAQLQVEGKLNTNLFYTGYGIPGPNTPMVMRERLARWLGSSSIFFVLRRTSPGKSLVV